MSRLRYYRTFQQGRQSTHVEGLGDFTLCGMDAVGDALIYVKDPEEVKGKPRITCDHCQQIIEIVREHLKK